MQRTRNAAEAAMEDPRPPRSYGRAPVVLLTREAYEGPILPHQIWQARGTAGHAAGTQRASGRGNAPTVTIVRLTTTGRVSFVRNHTRRGKGGRPHTVDEPVFRRQYELAQQVRSPDARFAVANAAALITLREGLITPGQIAELEEDARMDKLHAKLTAPTANGVLPEAPATRALVPNVPARGEAVAAPERPEVGPEPAPAEAAPAAPLTGPAAPDFAPLNGEAPVPEATLDAFLTFGTSSVEHLDGRLTRAQEDRLLLLEEIGELDARINTLRDQRDRIAAAVSAARAAATPTPTPAPVPEEAPAPPANERPPALVPRSLEARAIIEDGPTRTGPGRRRPSQLAWLASTLQAAPVGTLLSNELLAPRYVVTFGGTEHAARERLSILFSAWLKQSKELPQLVRVARGQYRVQSDATVAPESAPEPPAERPITQMEWILQRFAEQPLWTLRDLGPRFAEAFHLDHKQAMQTLSSRLTERIKHGQGHHPQFVRLSQGLYQAVP